MALDPHAARTPGVQHRKLEMFVGRWKVEGKNFAQAPNDPDSPVSGEETYELLPGGFFLMGRFQHGAAGSRHEGASVIGAGTDSYRCDNFDNLGYHRTYSLQSEGDTWTFDGEHERAKLTFGDSGRKFEIRWEISKDGQQWKPLCTLQATKAA